MEPHQPQPPLLAIAHGRLGTRVHFYPDIETLVGAGPFLLGGSDWESEFFDSRGYRLAPVFEGQWQMSSLRVTVDEPDPAGVLRRLRAAVADIEDFVRRITADLPALDDDDLLGAIDRCGPVFAHRRSEQRDCGSALHNLFVHGIW
jgi:hypothetical protein